MREGNSRGVTAFVTSCFILMQLVSSQSAGFAQSCGDDFSKSKSRWESGHSDDMEGGDCFSNRGRIKRVLLKGTGGPGSYFSFFTRGGHCQYSPRKRGAYTGFRRGSRLRAVVLRTQPSKEPMLLFLPAYKKNCDPQEYFKAVISDYPAHKFQEYQPTEDSAPESTSDPFALSGERRYYPIPYPEIATNQLTHHLSIGSAAKLSESVEALPSISELQKTLYQIWSIESESLPEGYSPTETESSKLRQLYNRAASLSNDEDERIYYRFLGDITGGDQECYRNLIFSKRNELVSKAELNEAIERELYCIKDLGLLKLYRFNINFGYFGSRMLDNAYREALLSAAEDRSGEALAKFERLAGMVNNDREMLETAVDSMAALSDKKFARLYFAQRLTSTHPIATSDKGPSLTSLCRAENRCICNRFHGWCYEKMPLKIYATDSKSPSPEFASTIKNCLEEWKLAIGGDFDFEMVSDPKNADITCMTCRSDHAAKEDQLHDKIKRKQGVIVLGRTRPECRDGKLFKSTVYIYLDRLKNYRDKFHAICQHELGHALGLGHTNNKEDIMYPSLDCKKSLSLTDCFAMYRLYHPVPANVHSRLSK